MAERNQNTRGSAMGTFAIIAALPVLYVLSLGPVVKMAEAGWLGPRQGTVVKAVRTFYLPLIWCHEEHVWIVGKALDWYVTLWRD